MESIHDLVHSLSLSEKRYFKIFCDRHVIGTSNRSVELFNLVAGQTVYDEEAIMRKLPFASTPEKLKKQKYRLQQLILKGMGYYHATSNLEMELVETVQQVRFLYSKGHFRLCLKLIDKGIAKAEPLEKNTALVMLLSWKARVLIRLSDFKGILEAVERQQAVLSQSSKDMKAMYAAFSILSKVNLEGMFRSQDEAEELRNELSALNGEVDIDGSFLSSYYAISAQGIGHAAIGEYAVQVESYRSIVQLFLERPHFIDDWPMAFLSTVNNLCNAHFSSLQPEDHLAAHNLLLAMRDRGLRTNDSNVRIQLELAVFNHGQTQLIYGGNLHEAKKTADMFVNLMGHELNRFSVPQRIQLFYDLAYLHFLTGDFRTSQFWLNRILNDMPEGSRHDLFGFAELMNILLHYERKHEGLTEYLERSFKRRLIADDRLYPAERIILRLLEQISNEPDRKAVNRHLDYAVSKFKVMRQDPYERDIWQYFDFISWLEAKRTGRSMQDVFRERMAGLWKR